MPQKGPSRCPNLGRQALLNLLATFSTHSSMILLQNDLKGFKNVFNVSYQSAVKYAPFVNYS